MWIRDYCSVSSASNHLYIIFGLQQKQFYQQCISLPGCLFNINFYLYCLLPLWNRSADTRGSLTSVLSHVCLILNICKENLSIYHWFSCNTTGLAGYKRRLPFDRLLELRETVSVAQLTELVDIKKKNHGNVLIIVFYHFVTLNKGLDWFPLLL